MIQTTKGWNFSKTDYALVAWSCQLSRALCWRLWSRLDRTSICPSATNENFTKQSHSRCRCRKRHYAMSIKRLLDARER
jgi:hypothetical protein